MAGWARRSSRLLSAPFLLLALLALTGCSLPFGGKQYLPADGNVDPYGSVRQRAEEYYQSGLEHERAGAKREALEDFRQARLWDPDNRKDIERALSRMEEQTGAQAYTLPTPAPGATEPPASPPAPMPSPDVPQPEAPSTAEGTPTRQFRSDHFPYTVSYPADWLAKEGGTAEQPVDAFVGEPDGGFEGLVMIQAESMPFGSNLDALYAATARDLEAVGVANVEVAEQRRVGGQVAYVLLYRMAPDSGKVSVRHAIFVTPGSAWHVVLLATPSTTPDLVETFDAMLDSLEIQSSAFPTL